MHQVAEHSFLKEDTALRPLLSNFAMPCVVIVMGIMLSIIGFITALHQANEQLKQNFIFVSEGHFDELGHRTNAYLRGMEIAKAGLDSLATYDQILFAQTLAPLLRRGKFSAFAWMPADPSKIDEVQYISLQEDTRPEDILSPDELVLTVQRLQEDPLRLDIQATRSFTFSRAKQANSDLAFLIPIQHNGVKLGNVIAVLDVHEVLVTEMHWSEDHKDHIIQIFDLGISQTQPMFRSDPTGEHFFPPITEFQFSVEGLAPYGTRNTISVIDRTWHISSVPSREYLARASGPLAWTVLLLGLTLTVVVGYLSFSTITRNISIRRQVDAQTAELAQMTLNLSNSNKKLGAILDNTVDGMITIDQAGCIESYNTACEEIFGYRFNEVVGQNIKMLMPEPYKAEHDGYLQSYFKTGKAKVIGTGREVQGKSKYGRVFPLDLAVSEVDLGDRRIFSGIVRDISDRKDAEERLKGAAKALADSNKELEQFAYVASHDLKAPLRAIDQLSSWIAEDLGDSLEGENKENMQLLRGRVQRMQNLLDDLLAYSRAGRDYLSQKNKIVTGETMFDDIILLLNPGDGFVVQASNNFKKICLPKLPLHQAILNLINNAIKHHDKTEGCVSVDAIDHWDRWEIIVTDDGPGIPEEYQEKIFEMFQTLQSRDRKEGSGMGLAMVKKIVASVGGKITVANNESRRGCHFTLTWPKAQPGQAESEDAEHGADPAAIPAIQEKDNVAS